MTKISKTIGGLLCLVGVLAYVFTGFESPTSLIPLFIGAPVLICGMMTDKQPDKRKLYMHIAVGLATLGFLASASRIPTLEEFGSIKSLSIWSMCVLCFILIGLYAQSFIKARSVKEG